MVNDGTGDKIMRKNIKPIKIEAVYELVGGGLSDYGDGKIIYHDDQTPPSDAEIDAKLAEMVKDWEDLQYAYKRQDAYPEIGDQLDDLYHAGAFSSDMASKLKKVKDDNPKS